MMDRRRRSRRSLIWRVPRALTLCDEVEAEGQLALEHLDLASLLLQREQVVAEAAAAVGVQGWRRRRVHLHAPCCAVPVEDDEREREAEAREGKREWGIEVEASRRKRIFFSLILSHAHDASKTGKKEKKR